MHEERLKRIVLDEVYRTITVQDGGRAVTMPVAQALIRSLSMQALKGRHRSQQLLTQLITATERSNRQAYDIYMARAIEFKTNADAELERRHRLGQTGADMIPHPDDIVVNAATGTVDILGPLTREQHDAWRQLARHRAIAEHRIAQFEAELATETDPDEIDDIQGSLRHFRKAHRLITGAIANWPANRRENEQ